MKIINIHQNVLAFKNFGLITLISLKLSYVESNLVICFRVRNNLNEKSLIAFKEL